MLQMKRILVLSIIALLAITACDKKPSDYFPVEPQIYYKSINKNIIDPTALEDTLKISLEFTDGDGDLGTDAQEQTLSIFLKDSRDTSASSVIKYPFPYIPPYMRPKNGSLQGSININLGSENFSIKDSLHLALRADTLFFRIYVMDNAGHVSDTVNTDTIYLKF